MPADISHIKTIAVCGAGTMGSGIAQVAAQAGFATIQYDVSAAMLSKSRQAIAGSLKYLTDRQKITVAESEAIQGRICYTNNLAECRAEVVIEAIIESAEAKIALFENLHAINGEACILASNTSSLSISLLQQQVPLPHRVAGMHFFNPAPAMKLVEIVQGTATGSPTVEQLFSLAQAMGKVPVHCKDAPGFIVNHVARTYYLEGLYLLEKGYADAATIDEVMEATGFKMGPFRLMDLIGMDINYSVSQMVWNAMGCPDRLKPSDIQKAKVEAGALGRKTGKGFYTYN